MADVTADVPVDDGPAESIVFGFQVPVGGFRDFRQVESVVSVGEVNAASFFVDLIWEFYKVRLYVRKDGWKVKKQPWGKKDSSF